MITATFLTNFALGFILAAEFGQVSVEIFRRGLKYGFRQAILTSLGGTFADFIYLNIAVTGIILVLNRPGILRFLWIIGGLVVLYTAVKGIRSSFEGTDINLQPQDTNPFVTGFLLNFIHPLNLIWWVTILSSIIVKDMQRTSVLTAYLNGSGIFFGVFGWWLALSIITAVAKSRFTLKALRSISGGSSIALLGFSFWFFYNAFIL